MRNLLCLLWMLLTFLMLITMLPMLLMWVFEFSDNWMKIGDNLSSVYED